MNIAVHAKVLSEEKLTGIGVYTYNLLNALASIDKENRYVLYSNEPIVHKIHASNFTEKILKFPFVWSYVRFPFEFIGDKYDLLFVPKEMVPLIKRPRTVVVCFDLMNFVFPELVKFNTHFWIAINYALKAADRIIAISESTRKDIIEYCDVKSDNIIVTPLGYDKELYKPCLDKDLISAVKEKYGIKGKYFINTSSVIWHRKNLSRWSGPSIHAKRVERVITNY